MNALLSNKLDDIQNEVRDFHPLLKALFEKMDEIEHVEYTQGTREFGADFVLCKPDGILGDTDYVGVIAKVTKIVQGDTEITRQIDECMTMPRVIRGNKNVYLNEIWVITCSTISTNAKDFFGKKYPSAKLKFIDKSNLERLVDKYLPNYWNNLPIAVSVYLAALRERLLIMQANSSFNISNIDGYEIQQTLIRREKDQYKRNRPITAFKKTTTTIFNLIEKKGMTMIEGGMGSGKSSLLRKTALRYCSDDEFILNKKIPVFTTLKELEERHDGKVSKLIDHTITAANLGDVDCSYLVFVDGADETKCSISDRIRKINQISNDASGIDSVKVIMAGRKIDEGVDYNLSGSNIKAYEISPLSIKNILSLIERACSGLSVANRIAHDLSKSNLFKMLPRTPIAAILLTRLIQENQQDIPSNLTELYSKYTELSLGRWDASKGGYLSNPKEYETVNKIIISLSKYFIDNNLFQISIDEAMNFFTDYLGKRNLGLDAEKLFNDFVERCDLVSVDADSNTFSFRHRTFSEYFYARGIPPNGYKEINEKSFDMYWSTINYFWVGTLKDCPSIIEEFSSVKPTKKELKYLKLINMGNFLMAANQTPFDKISESICEIFIEAGLIFNESRKGDVIDSLSKFSEMQLLCLFRHIMTEGYCYDFFKSAIESSMLVVEDRADLATEEKAIVLFLLNTVYMGLGGEEIFEGMIAKLGMDIPVSIQLAIRHEASSNSLLGGGIKKVHRNIKNMLSKMGAKQILEDLYEKPLKPQQVSRKTVLKNSV